MIRKQKLDNDNELASNAHSILHKRYLSSSLTTILGCRRIFAGAWKFEYTMETW